MFKKTLTISLVFMASLFILSSCNSDGNDALTSEDIEAIVNEIVEENEKDQQTLDEAIEKAVEATQQAVEEQATPVPTDEDYYKLTEEELTALIEEAVEAALEASAEVTVTTEDATLNESVSEEEVIYVSYAILYADEAIAYAESLVGIYYDIYGEYADYAVSALYEIESELESISNSLDSMEYLLYQGADAVNIALNELNAAAQEMEEKLTIAQEHTQQYLSEVHSDVENRRDDLMNLLPDKEASDRSQMIEMINGFAEEIKIGLGDGTLNRDEIQRISQAGINANAAIERFGGPQMKGWSDSITNLTRMAGEGNVPELQSGLKNFSVGLPELNKGLPDTKSLPDRDKSLPEKSTRRK
ncbi:MAG: hypothetical protein JEZ06_17690 [Anaerolineaceae bacterium]|nr:hypothetical protein [Anaerolineaceae bacterium]